MYAEDDLLPISALQHLAYCERQWALIHLEQVWSESRLTAEGRLLHDKAHDAETEVRGDVRIARDLRLRSLRLGLTGKADVVEFLRVPASEEGVTLEGIAGKWRPLIVEYKRGRPKIGGEDRIQLCAQALCLEEMLRTPIPEADFFYGTPRRRSHVTLDSDLRAETEKLADRLHQLTSVGITSPAEYGAKCVNCSLSGLCLPRAAGGQHSARRYLQRALAASADA